MTTPSDAFVLVGGIIDGTGADPIDDGAVAVMGEVIDWDPPGP